MKNTFKTNSDYIKSLLAVVVKKEMFFTNTYHAARTYYMLAEAGYNCDAEMSFGGGVVTVHLKIGSITVKP